MTDYKEFISYDVEIYEDLPEGNNIDLSKITPSVAAFCTDYENIHYYEGSLYRDWETDRKSTRLNSSHSAKSRMPSSA